MESIHRELLLFEQGIRSKYTRKNYLSHLRQFERFSGLDGAGMVSISRDNLQMILENYLIELKCTTNPNSIPSRFQGIRHFCVMNRISLDWNIIGKMFPQKQKTVHLRSYTSDEIRDMVNHAKNIRDRALIHFLASTGARIGVFDHGLTMRHIRPMPDSYAAVLLYAGDVEEYWGFLTPQAFMTLCAYHDSRKTSGESFCSDTPIFATRGDTSKQLGWSGARSTMYRIVSKSGILRHKKDGRYDVQIDHGLRKRFNTILKLDNSVNYNIAEKLMGHKNGLDGVYFTPTINELLEEFRKITHKIEI